MMADNKMLVRLSIQQEEMLKLENIDFSEIILKKRSENIYNRYIKRILDIVFALIAILIISPVLLIVSIAVVIETGFPILYRADRGGNNGKTFKINKFRTMVKDADKIGGGTTALNDSRITKVGLILRKTKIDELPQLFNVLGGSMSFIGPRPELLRYTDQYQGIERCILYVRPGITDYSSLTFISLDEIVGSKNADDIYETYVLKKKNELRLKYVRDISFGTDIKIFFSTIAQVLKKAVLAVMKHED